MFVFQLQQKPFILFLKTAFLISHKCYFFEVIPESRFPCSLEFHKYLLHF